MFSKIFNYLVLIVVGISIAFSIRFFISSWSDEIIEMTSFDYIDKGDQLFEEQSYSQALLAYEQAAGLEPQNAVARWRIGQLYQLKNRFAEAETELRIAATLDPYNLDVWYRLGQIQLETRNWSKAVEYFQKALDLIKNQPTKEATAVVDTAYNQDTSNLQSPILAGLGQAFLWLGEIEKAQNALASSVDIDGSQINTQLLYALILASQNIEQGVGHLQILLESNDGLTEFDRNKIDQAYKNLQTASSMSDYLLRRLQLASVFLQLNVPTLALPVLKEIVAIEPNYQLAQTYLGRAYFLVGDLSRAQDALESSLTLGSGPLALSYYYLGELHTHLGQYSEAIEAYDQAYKLGDSSFENLYHFGLALSKAGQYSKAIKAFEKALEIRPHSTQARTSAINVYLSHLKDPSAALKIAQAGVEIDDKNGRHHDLLGWALLEKGEKKEAQEAFLRAIELDPSISSAHYNLGLLLEEQGQITRAKKEYHLALELDFEGVIAPLADQALQRLQEL